MSQCKYTNTGNKFKEQSFLQFLKTLFSNVSALTIKINFFDRKSNPLEPLHARSDWINRNDTWSSPYVQSAVIVILKTWI